MKNMVKRVIIAGTRGLPNSPEQEKIIRDWLLTGFLLLKPDVILCGAAKGIDTLGALMAKEYGAQIEYYPADWDGLGKRAGYVRNVQMAENADELWLIWDGKSPGSKMMKNIALQRKLLVLEYVV